MRKIFLALILLFSLTVPSFVQASAATTTLSVKSVKKYGYSTVNRTVYASESTKAKKLGTLKKKTHVYVYSSRKGYYKVKFNHKNGYIPTSRLRIGFADGWKAPVLKSKWSPNHETNLKTLQNELGFKEGGTVYGVKGYSNAINIVDEGGKYEVNITFYGWEDTKYIPQTYRVPIVAKELFKLYFGNDATKVWDYFDKNDIPDNFTAGGRKVHAYASESVGSITLQILKK